MLNQAIMMARLLFHHIQSIMTGGIAKQLCTIGMPSGSLNENLRTDTTFGTYLMKLFLLFQKLTAECCVTNLRMPCIK
jgi:hypothetical protein